MTDSAPPEIVIEDAVLAAVAARAALATPGVARLEPGMRGLVSSLVRKGRQRRTGAEPASADGVRVRHDTGGALSVRVDLVLAAGCRVATVGCAVQREVSRVVWEQTGAAVAEVSVTVTDIEPEPS
ncbi:Asp23/Gls24 family envelope stress response protein [Nocardia arizonensis]|uniref:Asp23/Gls24 family envelope stress response protein n=1 Tax=Nocardia arizonensis TaxID=1141647 RepID=UPI0006D05F98|nr:Asp23/Gls24 family envelope stress response protein [Nocardia arizonensis]